jgi:hypothetical protein
MSINTYSDLGGEEMPVKYGEFKGFKTISLMRDENDKYPFTFGVAKAKTILENIDEIRKFVEQNSRADAGEE